jgi:hypothetical protein
VTRYNALFDPAKGRPREYLAEHEPGLYSMLHTLTLFPSVFLRCTARAG